MKNSNLFNHQVGDLYPYDDYWVKKEKWGILFFIFTILIIAAFLYQETNLLFVFAAYPVLNIMLAKAIIAFILAFITCFLITYSREAQFKNKTEWPLAIYLSTPVIAFTLCFMSPFYNSPWIAGLLFYSSAAGVAALLGSKLGIKIFWRNVKQSK